MSSRRGARWQAASTVRMRIQLIVGRVLSGRRKESETRSGWQGERRRSEGREEAAGAGEEEAARQGIVARAVEAALVPRARKIDEALVPLAIRDGERVINLVVIKPLRDAVALMLRADQTVGPNLPAASSVKKKAI